MALRVHSGSRRARSQGRCLFLRRGHTDDLGGAVPHDERHTAAPRFLHPRVDGLRPASGHWGAAQSSRSSSRRIVRRRRSRDAHGRVALASPVAGAGQGDRLQERNALAFVELEMKAAGILDFGTDLHNPDFAKMAEAAGVLGLTAETADQVRPMMTRAFEHDGPALLAVRVHRQELAMPPTISLEQMTGFSLFMLKAVLSGRGDELIDLAKINLFR